MSRFQLKLRFEDGRFKPRPAEREKRGHALAYWDDQTLANALKLKPLRSFVSYCVMEEEELFEGRPEGSSDALWFPPEALSATVRGYLAFARDDPESFNQHLRDCQWGVGQKRFVEVVESLRHLDELVAEAERDGIRVHFIIFY